MKIPNRHRLPVNESRVCCFRDLILFLFAVNKSAPSICGNEISPLAVVHREKFPRGETFRLRNPQKFVPRGIFAETKQSGIRNETLRRRKVYWNVMRGGPMIILSEIHRFTRQRGWVTKLWLDRLGDTCRLTLGNVFFPPKLPTVIRATRGRPEGHPNIQNNAKFFLKIFILSNDIQE